MHKLVLLGDPAVGKTTLLTYFTMGSFNTQHNPTVGAGCSTYHYTKGDFEETVQIWDTAGSEVYKSMAPIYTRDAFAAMIVIDLTQEKTLQSVQEWQKYLQSPVPTIVVGNKCDLRDERKILHVDAYEYCKELNCDYLETSAYTGEGVENAFQAILDRAFEASTMQQEPVDAIDLRGTITKKKSCC